MRPGRQLKQCKCVKVSSPISPEDSRCSLLLRHRHTNNAETDVADSQGWSVIALSGGNALECSRLIPTAAAYDGQSGGKSVDRIEGEATWPTAPRARRKLIA